MHVHGVEQLSEPLDELAIVAAELDVKDVDGVGPGPTRRPMIRAEAARLCDHRSEMITEQTSVSCPAGSLQSRPSKLTYHYNC
jgi:hypothetical protein